MVEAVHSSLLLDGESVYSLVANPLLLLLARVILTKCSSKMDNLQVRLSFWPGGAAAEDEDGSANGRKRPTSLDP